MRAFSGIAERSNLIVTPISPGRMTELEASLEATVSEASAGRFAAAVDRRRQAEAWRHAGVTGWTAEGPNRAVSPWVGDSQGAEIIGPREAVLDKSWVLFRV